VICPLSNRNNDLRGTYDDARRGCPVSTATGFQDTTENEESSATIRIGVECRLRGFQNGDPAVEQQERYGTQPLPEIQKVKRACHYSKLS
jgi:hypothetical protein